MKWKDVADIILKASVLLGFCIVLSTVVAYLGEKYPNRSKECVPVQKVKEVNNGRSSTR